MNRLLILALLALPAFAQYDFAPHNMTTDSAPSPYAASSSSTFQDACCGPYAAFDGLNGHEWIGQGGGVDWLQLNLGAGNTGTLTSYAILGPLTAEAARAPKNFTLQGKLLVGDVWTTIDTETNQTGWTNSQRRTFSANSAAYRYFRLNITANNGDVTYTDVVESYLFGSSTVPYTCTPGSTMTLFTSAALSASGGQWSGCLGGSYIPTSGDQTVIAPGVNLAVDQNWTIGASGAINTTAAISLIGTGAIEVKPGAMLIARGDVLADSSCPGAVTTMFQLDAGSTFAFDSSQAVSPTTTRYRMGASTTTNYCSYRTIAMNGTAASHVTVTSVLTNGALPGQFRMGANAVGSASPAHYLAINATHTDFSYIGDALANGESFAFVGDSYGDTLASFQYCTFNHDGPWYTGANTQAPTDTLLVDHSVWANSLGANNIFVAPTAVPTTGAYSVTNNYFDLNWNSSQSSPGCNGGVRHYGVALSGNVFAGGYCPPSYVTDDAPWSANLISTGCLTETSFGGSAPSGAYVWCNVDQGNPHVSGPEPWAQTLINAVFDHAGTPATTGFGKAFHAGGAAGVAVGLLNSVLLPNRYGYATLIIADHTPSITSNVATYNHNAGVVRSGMDTDELGATSATVPSYKSNAWAASLMGGAGPGWLISNSGGTPALDLCVTSTGCDYNSIYPLSLSTAQCPTCTGAQNGYVTKMDFSPNYTGAHDLSTVNYPTFRGPYFADLTRRLATADTLLFHTTASKGIWTVSTSYAVGDSALVNHSAAVYYGSPVNYQCIKAHTATADNEPEEGSYTQANGGLLALTVSANVATAVFAEGSQLAVGNQIHISASGSVPDALAAIASVSTTTIANDTITFPLTLANGTYTSSGNIQTWMVFWQPNTLATLATKLATGATFLDGAVPGCQTTACGPVSYLINWVLRGYTPQNPALWCSGHDGEAIGAVPFCATGKVLIGALAGM